MISKILDHALLSAFIEASRAGTFSSAAKTLGRSQSQLTSQIQRLEDILGFPLFFRTPRGVKLTQKGNELLVYAQRIAYVAEDAIRHIAINGQKIDRLLRVRISEDLAGKALLKLLIEDASFAKIFELEIVSSGVAPAASAFESGKVDIFLGDLSANLSDSIRLAKSVAIPLVWAASENFDPSRRPLPLGLYPTDCTWRGLIIRTMDEALVHYVPAVESESLSALQAAAIGDNVMIACLPSSFVQGLIPVDHETFRIPEPPKVEIAMYLARAKSIQPELTELAEYLWRFISRRSTIYQTVGS